MSGLFGGGGSKKSKRQEGYIAPEGTVPQPEEDTRFPAPGAVPRSTTPTSTPMVGGFDDVGNPSTGSNLWG